MRQNLATFREGMKPIVILIGWPPPGSMPTTLWMMIARPMKMPTTLRSWTMATGLERVLSAMSWWIPGPVVMPLEKNM